MAKTTKAQHVDEAIAERLSTKTLQSIEDVRGNLLELSVSEQGVTFSGRVSWTRVRRMGGRIGKLLIPFLLWGGWKNAPQIVELIKRVP